MLLHASQKHCVCTRSRWPWLRVGRSSSSRNQIWRSLPAPCVRWEINISGKQASSPVIRHIQFICIFCGACTHLGHRIHFSKQGAQGSSRISYISSIEHWSHVYADFRRQLKCCLWPSLTSSPENQRSCSRLRARSARPNFKAVWNLQKLYTFCNFAKKKCIWVISFFNYFWRKIWKNFQKPRFFCKKIV